MRHPVTSNIIYMDLLPNIILPWVVGYLETLQITFVKFTTLIYEIDVTSNILTYFSL